MVAATERQKLANASLKYGPCGNGKVSRNHAAARCTRLGRCYMNHRFARRQSRGRHKCGLVGRNKASFKDFTHPAPRPITSLPAVPRAFLSTF
jgi:hypothetical protein